MNTAITILEDVNEIFSRLQFTEPLVFELIYVSFPPELFNKMMIDEAMNMINDYSADVAGFSTEVPVVAKFVDCIESGKLPYNQLSWKMDEDEEFVKNEKSGKRKNPQSSEKWEQEKKWPMEDLSQYKLFERESEEKTTEDTKSWFFFYSDVCGLGYERLLHPWLNFKPN